MLKVEKTPQGLLIGALSVALGFIVFKIVMKMLGESGVMESFASAQGDTYYTQGACDFIQANYGESCSEHCVNGGGTWSNCAGDPLCGSNDVGSCAEGSATGTLTPTATFQTQAISTRPSTGIPPRKRPLRTKFF
jgi:hypothetical protein